MEVEKGDFHDVFNFTKKGGFRSSVEPELECIAAMTSPRK